LQLKARIFGSNAISHPFRTCVIDSSQRRIDLRRQLPIVKLPTSTPSLGHVARQAPQPLHWAELTEMRRAFVASSTVSRLMA